MIELEELQLSICQEGQSTGMILEKLLTAGMLNIHYIYNRYVPIHTLKEPYNTVS